MPDNRSADYMVKISADTSEFTKEMEAAGKKADDVSARLARSAERWKAFTSGEGMKAVNQSLEEQKQWVADIQAKYQRMYDLQRGIASTGKTLNAEMKTVAQSVNDAAKSMSNLQTETKGADDRIQKMLEEMSDSETFSAGAKAILADIQAIKEEMQSLASERFETKEHIQIGKNIEKAEAALDKLIEKQKKMDATGVDKNSKQYRTLEHNIEQARKKVADLEAEEERMERTGEAFTFGTDTAAYKEKEEQLQRLNGELEAYYNEYKRLNDVISRALGTDTAEHTEEAVEEATETISEMQSRVKAGTQAIAQDVKRVTEEFSNMAAENAPDTGVEEVSDQVEEANKRVSMLGALLQRLKIPDDASDDVADFTERTSILKDLWDRFTLRSGAFSEEAAAIREEIEEIEARMRELSETQIETDDYLELQAQIDAADKTLEKLLEKQDKMQAVGVKESSSAWKGLQYDIEQARTMLATYRDEQEEMKADGSGFMSGADGEEFAGLEERLAELRDELAEVESEGTSHAENVGEAFRHGFATVARSGLDVLKKAWSGFGKVMQTGLKNIQNGFKSFVSHIKNIKNHSNALNDVVKKVHQTFTSFASLLKTRIKRMFIGEVFKDLKENVGLVAQTSERFNTAISGMMDSCKQFGLQVVAAFEPLISIVAPYISAFIDKLTEGADTIAQFVARLTGNETYLKATKGQTDYAKSLDKTTKSTEKAEKATKKYQNTVLSFDQLHKLNGVDDTKDDASALTGVTDAQLQKAETQATAINGIADRIREALKAGKFKEAGKEVAGLINNGFAAFKDLAGWEKNSEKFSKILKNVIDFTNGIAEGLDGKAIGNAIGDVANTLIEGFGMLVDPEEGIDFGLFGQKFGDMIVEAVKEIHWEQLGADFVEGIQAIVRFVNGVITRDGFFEELGDALSEMFKGAVDALDPEEWATAASGLINGFFTFLSHAFADREKMVELGHKLAEFINKTFEELDAENATSGINAAVDGITSAINTLFEEVHWDEVLDKLATILKGLHWGGIAELVAIAAAPSIVGGFVSGIGSFIFGGGLVSLVGNGVGKLGSLIGGLFGGGSGAGAAAAGAGGMGAVPAVGLAVGAGTTVAGLSGTGALKLMGASDEYIEERGFGPLGFLHDMATLLNPDNIKQVFENTKASIVEAMAAESANKGGADDAEKRVEETENHENITSVKDAIEEIKTAIQEEFARQVEIMPAADAIDAASEKFVDLMESHWEVEDATMKEGFAKTVEAISEATREVIQTILQTAQTDTGDVVLVVDSEEIARASLRGQRSIDKRTNPTVSFA